MESGILYLDEIHVVEPVGTLGVAVRSEVQLSLPGALFELHAVPLLANVIVSGTGYAATEGFSPSLYGRPADTWTASARLDGGGGCSVSPRARSN